MKQKFTKLVIFCFAYMGYVGFMTAQNIFPTAVSGFEVPLFIGGTAAPVSSFTGALEEGKKFDGLRSIKFAAPDAGIITGGNISAIIGGTNVDFAVGNIPVGSGEHTLSIKIFIEDQAPAVIAFYLAEKSAVITNGMLVVIPTANVPKGSWQTISTVVDFPTAIAEMKTGVRVRGSDYVGMTGPSTIYLDQVSLVKGLTSSTTSINAPEFNVYPNPASDHISIAIAEESDVLISNISGMSVKSLKGVSSNAHLSVSDLASGVYFVRVTSNGVAATKKLIVE
ncbi:MAG: T9SS type A sorting domain-containing protein [Saprospiraceae bacterium]